MSKENKVPAHILSALAEAELELLDLQEDILELAESVPDYVARLPYAVSEELH